MSARITPPWALPDTWFRVTWHCGHVSAPCATHDPEAESELYRRDFDTEAEALLGMAEHEGVKGHWPWMVEVRGEKVAEAREVGARVADGGEVTPGATAALIDRNGTIQEGAA